MNTSLECLPCLGKNAVDAAKRSTADPALRQRIVAESLRLLAENDFRLPPPFTARKILEESGVRYPNVIGPENDPVFSRVTGFPTNFFVDSEGRILTDPIVGAAVAEYEEGILFEIYESKEDDVVIVRPNERKLPYFTSLGLKKDPDDWVNSALARYFGKNSIKMDYTDEE